MARSSYIPVEGTVQNLSSMQGSCCNQLLTLSTSNGIVTFVVSRDTYIANNLMLRRGMRVVAFYDENLPVPLIFPPRYQAEVITLLGRNESVALNYFNRNLLAQDNSLQLNISPATNITTANGQRFTCRLGDNLLLVYYSTTTRSLPPQTTPHRIIVFC